MISSFSFVLDPRKLYWILGVFFVGSALHFWGWRPNPKPTLFFNGILYVQSVTMKDYKFLLGIFGFLVLILQVSHVLNKKYINKIDRPPTCKFTSVFFIGARLNIMTRKLRYIKHVNHWWYYIWSHIIWSVFTLRNVLNLAILNNRFEFYAYKLTKRSNTRQCKSYGIS